MSDPAPKHTHKVEYRGPAGIKLVEDCPRCRWLIREKIGEGYDGLGHEDEED